MIPCNELIGKVRQVVEAAEKLHEYAYEAAKQGTAVHEVEQILWERLLQMGQMLLQQFFDMQGNGDLGEWVTLPEGKVFCWSRDAPPAEEEGEILVETADGKGVPIRRPADAPRIHDHQCKSGPKPDRKKMATIGAVYSVDRHMRTAEEVVDSLFRTPDEERPPSERPRPCHKRTYARITVETEDGEAIDGQLAVLGWIRDEVQARDPDGSKEKVCVMDGQRSLWETKALVQEDVVITEILDLLHVTPRLWEAANLFYGCGNRQAEQCVRQRVLWILEGRVDSVIRSLRNMATRNLANKKKKREQIERICRYFENNKGNRSRVPELVFVNLA